MFKGRGHLLWVSIRVIILCKISQIRASIVHIIYKVVLYMVYKVILYEAYEAVLYGSYKVVLNEGLIINQHNFL